MSNSVRITLSGEKKQPSASEQQQTPASQPQPVPVVQQQSQPVPVVQQPVPVNALSASPQAMLSSSPLSGELTPEEIRRRREKMFAQQPQSVNPVAVVQQQQPKPLRDRVSKSPNSAEMFFKPASPSTPKVTTLDAEKVQEGAFSVFIVFISPFIVDCCFLISPLFKLCSLLKAAKKNSSMMQS